MTKNRRNRPLQVEALESYVLLTGLPAAGMIQAAAVSAADALHFSGTTKGTFVATQSNPDTGKDYHVVTQGKTTIGTPIAVTGDLVTPGFVAQGRTTGTLTVTTAKGTLTLAISSPLQKGFSPLPSLLTYRITGGTGVFANQHSGRGTISVSYHVLNTAAGSATGFSQAGTISLVFRWS